MSNVDWQQRLVALRNEKRLSMAEVARRAGIAKAGLWKIEHGVTQPMISTVQKIATVLGTTLSDLFAEPRDAHTAGEPHDYRIECVVCGQRGVVRLTIEPGP